ncbi:MAG: hypothetical protein CMI32_06615 [Opitutales bacterium]|nr:hypothetical protein [Opitutales bacterium]
MNPIEYWEHLRFAEPHWLWFALLVPLLVYLRTRLHRSKASLKFSSLSSLKTAKLKSLWLSRTISPAIRLLALVSLILALSRPQLDESTRSIQESGVDIVLAVDLSASMLALDMSENNGEPVTRLDVVKRVIKDFVTKRKHDRIGLVGFSVNPYLLSSLTLDKEYLRRNLERLRVGLTHQTGTNIGGALAEGINRVRQLEAETRIVILLTDGKDEPPPRHSPLVFAEGAKRDGIKIYTIAVGRSTRTPSYVYDQRNRDLLLQPDGKPVIRMSEYPVDKDILRNIAETTGAQFFEAGDEASLREIYDEIDRLEKTDVEYDVNALYEELFHWPLVLGLVLLLIEIVLSRTLLLRIP